MPCLANFLVVVVVAVFGICSLRAFSHQPKMRLPNLAKPVQFESSTDVSPPGIITTSLRQQAFRVIKHKNPFDRVAVVPLSNRQFAEKGTTAPKRLSLEPPLYHKRRLLVQSLYYATAIDSRCKELQFRRTEDFNSRAERRATSQPFCKRANQLLSTERVLFSSSFHLKAAVHTDLVVARPVVHHKTWNQSLRGVCSSRFFCR